MNPLSFNTFNHSPYMGTEVGIRTQIDAAAQAGFPLIGIDSFSLDAVIAGGGTMQDVSRWLEAAGIDCGAIICAGMLGSDPGATSSVTRAGERARALGAPFVQINVDVSGDAQRVALEGACAVIGDGVRLAIEYLPFSPLCSVTDTVALARSVGFDRAGVLIDIWHHICGPDDWDALAAVPATAIAYVEFDDAPMPGGDLEHATVQYRTLPGEGAFDLARFVRTIEATGYLGPVSVEILSAEWRRQDVKTFAARAFSSSRPYWAASACA